MSQPVLAIVQKLYPILHQVQWDDGSLALLIIAPERPGNVWLLTGR